MIVEIQGVSFEMPASLSEMKLSHYVEVSRANKKHLESEEIKDGIHFLNVLSNKDFNFLLEGFSLISIGDAIGNCRVLFNSVATNWEIPALTDDFYKFEYKGIEYRTSIYGVGSLINGNLNYAEYSECREADRHIDRNDDGTTEFTSMCKFIGVIAKPVLGIDPDETALGFVERTNAAALHFQEIDAKTALDIDFFFGNTLKI